MVVNKKPFQKSAKNLNGKKIKEIEKNYVECIESAVCNIDDRKSSKFVAVNNSKLESNNSSTTQPENIDLKKARQAVLDELKLKENVEEEQVKKKKPILKMPELRLKVKKPKLPKQKKIKKKIDLKTNFLPRLKVIIYTFLFFIFFCLLVITLGIYLGRWQGPLVNQVTKIIPYPIAYVNGESIKSNAFFGDLTVLSSFLQRQNKEVGDATVRQQTLDRLIEWQITKQLAKTRGVIVNDAEVSEYLTQALGSPELKEEAGVITQDLYGWDFEIYLEKVIKPLVLFQKVEQDFYQTEGGEQIVEKMASINKLLSDDASRFSKIASEVNQDGTQVVNGDLGWLKIGDTAPEFEFHLLELKPGQLSKVFETRHGYHIIKLEEKLINDEDESVFHVSHIFMKPTSFDDYLDEQIKKATVVTLIRI